ncbi:hypothetical protein [Algicella marina]|uniref:Uncharacterized protein n=1 Tax=Algicella marina TaxID=2683284 RepID=A0A6P1SYW9_9RHOB|nr:hypothetical protein [Algicella marina]QHQ34209.1 hypothetical protein GO499_02890 [Algicella marina]
MIPSASIDPAPAASGAITNAAARSEAKGEKTELPPSKAVREAPSVPPTAIQKMVRDLSEAEAKAREAEARADAARQAAVEARAEEVAKSEEVSQARSDASNSADESVGTAETGNSAPSTETRPPNPETVTGAATEPVGGRIDTAESTNLANQREAALRETTGRIDPGEAPPPSPFAVTGPSAATQNDTDAGVNASLARDVPERQQTPIERDVEIVNGTGKPEPQLFDVAA